MALHGGPREHATQLKVAVASAFGLGLSPIGPGTCGALLGVAMHLGVLAEAPPGWRTLSILGCLGLVSIAHWLLTPFAVAHWKQPDPSHFVLDEVAGYLVVAAICPFMTTPLSIAAGFLLFRALDIFKPPPARQIDRDWTGAAGILCDDLVSGGYAGGLLWAMKFVANARGWQL